MTVVLADVDEAAVAALRDELTAAGGSRGRRRSATSAIRTPLQELADRTYRDVGPVRLLVNNAGVEQFGYLWDTPVANWNRVVDINISGVFHGVRAFLPKMIAAGTPAWVWNLSSIGGVAVVPLQAPYIMSKHAVLALTECLRLEVQLAGHDHIHVQAVLPGAVVSNIFESAGGVRRRRRHRRRVPARGDARHQGRRDGSRRRRRGGVRAGRRGPVLPADPARVRRLGDGRTRQRACRATAAACCGRRRRFDPATH